MTEHLNQRFLETILDGSPGTIYILNLETETIKYTSNTTQTLAGYSPEEMKAMHDNFLANIVHPEDLSTVRQTLQIIQKSKSDQTTSVEYRLIPKGPKPKHNEYPWVASYLRPIERNNQNAVVRVCGIAIEITALKSTQLELERKNLILSNIAKSNPAHVAITDAETDIITYVSRSLRESFGYSLLREGASNNFYTIAKQMMVPEDYKTVTKIRDDAIESGKPERYQFEFKLYGVQKVFHWLLYTCSPYELDSKGNVKSLIHFAIDITKWKEIELQLKTKNSELEQFSYVSSHDLKQPLNTIESSLKLLLSELKNYEYSTDIMNAIDSITNKTMILKRNIQSVLK